MREAALVPLPAIAGSEEAAPGDSGLLAREVADVGLSGVWSDLSAVSTDQVRVSLWLEGLTEGRFGDLEEYDVHIQIDPLTIRRL